MPSRNTQYREDIDDGYYHVYGRGAARQEIYLDGQDYSVFLNLLKRYLSKEPYIDKQGRKHTSFYGQVELLAFCIMPNHFHLLLHQVEAKTIAKMMQGLVGSYGRYFNIKYKRSGPLLESRYKSSIILSDEYLLHASRYIHLNPDDYENWPWSSLPYYTKGWSAEWVQPQFILDMHSRFSGSYKDFVDEYKTKRDEINEVKYKYLEEYDEPSANYYSHPELLYQVK
ncbi:hypothetical protein FACS189431_2440 [Alphaproteobacteria bacterium]|nr:hypothetical protein FACS189431_2440 [Alphaproteobacteria bacterium]